MNNSYDLLTIAERIGLQPQGRGAWSPCPICGATHRGSDEKRGPISFFKSNQAWKCHAGSCGAGGDAVTLYAAKMLGRIPERSEKEIWAGIFTELDGRDSSPRSTKPRMAPRTPPVEPPSAPYPPQDQVHALWNACIPLSEASPDDPALGYLRLRGLDPTRIGEQGLARLLPTTHPWPEWIPASYRKEHRLVVPVFDASGALRALRFRADAKLSKKKAFPPIGFPCKGLVMADPLAQAILQGHKEIPGIRWDGRVVVVEGEPDLWSWSARRGREEQIQREGRSYAVMGVVSGSWTSEIAARLPNETVVLLRTHQDAKGDSYAEEIQATLQDRCLVKRPPRTAYGTTSDHLPDENDRLIARSLPADPESETLPLHSANVVAAMARISGLPWVRPSGVWLDAKPLPRPYLLHLPSNPGAQSLRGDGMIPRGKVGILAAAGGVGKTFALCGLALSIVTGQPWLGFFPVGTDLKRRVVLVLGEEDEPELRRRLYQQSTAMALMPPDTGNEIHEFEREQSRQAIERILALPGSGLDTLALTQAEEDGRQARTDFANAFFLFLEAEGHKVGGWDAIILDPLSRFAGPDVETDNAAATRLIQVLERFTKLPGEPAVLVAHHTNKASRGSDSGVSSSASVRGSSALVDGARWVANLDEMILPGGSRYPGATRFRVTKSNYGRIPPDELTLARTGEGGLRVANKSDLNEIDKAISDIKAREAASKKSTAKSQEAASPFRKGDA